MQVALSQGEHVSEGPLVVYEYELLREGGTVAQQAGAKTERSSREKKYID